MVKHPFDSDDMDRTTPQTEDSAERGFVDQGNEADPDSYGDLGWSDELDQEGDIADEGRGHRG